MIPVLLILIPVITGLIAFFLPGEKAPKIWTLLSAIVTLGVAVAGVYSHRAAELNFNESWIPMLGTRIAFSMDGMAKMLEHESLDSEQQ